LQDGYAFIWDLFELEEVGVLSISDSACLRKIDFVSTLLSSVTPLASNALMIGACPYLLRWDYSAKPQFSSIDMKH
jgi:hypothetical protein